MILLILGIVIFFGVHLLPGMVGMRQSLAERLGERQYQGVFSLVSLLGFVLMVGSATLVVQHLRGNSESGRQEETASGTFGSWLSGRRFGRFRRR